MKKAKRLNVIDVIIILLVILSIVFLVSKLVFNYNNAPKNENIRFVLKTEDIDTVFSKNLSVGDKIYTKDNKKEIGVISNISLSPSYYYGTDKNGKIVQTEIKDKSVLYLTIDTIAAKSDVGFHVGETVINIGKSFDIVSKNISLITECVSLQIQNLE